MSRRRSQAGTSLVEVLVAVTILAVGVAPLLFGLTTTSIQSSSHRHHADADTVVRSFAEVLKQQVAKNGYRPCAEASDYTKLWDAVPAGFSVGVDSISYWDDAGGAFVGTSPTCHDRAQLLRLHAASSGSTDRETVEIVVRQP